jgi:hypothetical protein
VRGRVVDDVRQKVFQVLVRYKLLWSCVAFQKVTLMR